MTFPPRRRNSGASRAATPCGVQRKSSSQPEKAGSSGGTTGKSPAATPRKDGKISANRRPAWEREEAATISTRGCPASNRTSSPPVYPLTPIIPALTTLLPPQPERSMPNIIYQTGPVGNILIQFL